jgi:O-antigen/teichoic acid export membrane protein
MKRTLQDLAATASSVLGGKLFFFVSAVILARGISPSAYGRYTLLTSVAVLLIPVVDLGLYAVAGRARAGGQFTVPLSATAAVDRVRTLPWLLGAALFILIAAITGWTSVWLATLAYLGACAQSETDTMGAEFRSSNQYAAAALLRSAAGTLSVPLTVAAVLLAPSVSSAMLVFALCRAIPAAVIRLRHASAPVRHHPAVTLRIGLPFTLTTTLIILYVQSDVVIMSLDHIPYAVIAGYGVAYSILGALQTLPTVVIYLVFPRMVVVSPERARSLAGLALTASCCVGGTASAIFLFFPRLSFRFFGRHYAAEADLVIPLLSVLLPLSVSLVNSALLQARHLERRLVPVSLVALALNLGLNFALIPPMGVRGALIATSLGEGSAACVSTLILRRNGLLSSFVPQIVFSSLPILLTTLHMPTQIAASLLILLVAAVVGADVAGIRSFLLALLLAGREADLGRP